MADDGITRSAILLMSLGEDEAAGVFKNLGPREVQKIGAAMATLKNVTRDEIKSVLGEFCAVAKQQTSVGLGSDDYVRNVLKKAIGDAQSTPHIDSILAGG